MLRAAVVQPFVSTTDLERARAFYEGVLGLVVVEDNGFAIVVEGGNASIRITRAPEVDPPGHTVLGWIVDDLDSVVDELVAAGVELLRFDGMEQSDHGVWTAPGGDRVAWFHDPDRNVLSVNESAG